jgi:cell division protein FtsW
MLVVRRNSLLYFTLFLILIALSCGLIFIYSSSSVYALEKCGTPLFFVKKQLFGHFLGLIGMAIGVFLPLPVIKRLTPLFFYGTLFLTGLTGFVGLSLNGSRRWLSLAGIIFQPSELLKIGFILYAAFFLSKKESRIGSLWHTTLAYALIIILTCLVLLKQPDFGQAVVLASTGMLMLLSAGGSLRHLAAGFFSLVPVLAALVAYKPYRLRRIAAFLHPWDDPQGAGFQIIQSLIAIGSGSLTGLGIGNSKQKFFYLPMQHTDFIFSIIAEETGFVGCFLCVILFLSIFYCGLRLALGLSDRFSQLLVLGFFLLITLQGSINMAVAVGLLPTKGIGLPFFSYGISSLFSTLSLLGVVINASRYRL